MNNRPYVLCIANSVSGNDAGITSEITTFEQHKVFDLESVTTPFLKENQVVKVVNNTFRAIRITLAESTSVMNNLLNGISKIWQKNLMGSHLLVASARFSFFNAFHRHIRHSLINAESNHTFGHHRNLTA
ncbi:MAG: hypothetical protein N4A71_18935 [Carboxylicivirga sp.]|jgi:hypothetical protein|nr:hypothetical protein [Carboxylicivirga sp.]